MRLLRDDLAECRQVGAVWAWTDLGTKRGAVEDASSGPAPTPRRRRHEGKSPTSCNNSTAPRCLLLAEPVRNARLVGPRRIAESALSALLLGCTDCECEEENTLHQQTRSRNPEHNPCRRVAVQDKPRCYEDNEVHN